MKFITLSAAFLMSFSAFAEITVVGNAAQEIYDALSVTAQSVNPDALGQSVLKKSVGGLECLREQVVVPDALPSFSCTVSAELDALVVYNTLSVPAVVLNPDELQLVTMKTAGPLSCTRTDGFYPGAKATFECYLAH